jgi:hypothetical protein
LLNPVPVPGHEALAELIARVRAFHGLD